jgi:hypothetical protein
VRSDSSSLHLEGLFPPKVALLLLLVAFPARRCRGQVAGSDLPAGGEWERYYRALQVAGESPLRLWTIRGFSDKQVEAMRRNREWDRRALPASHRWQSVDWSIAATEAGVVGNSAFPFGMNDGPLWSGRGITAFATTGIASRRGPVSLSLRPFVFAAQNAAFPLGQTGQAGRLIFNNNAYPLNIDNPQRFGDGVYTRIDPGESTLRVELGSLGLGASTAAQFWGPAVEHPLILGNNAGGFPYLFAGTTNPIRVGPLVGQARIIWGRLKQSQYGPMDLGHTHFGTGLVISGGLHAVPGLEIGGARFFHIAWRDGGFWNSPFFAPFQGLLKNSLASPDNPNGDNPQDNQLASIFARWVLPSSHVEMYAEYGREDHNWDARDLALEPDHDAGYVLGLMRAWGDSSKRLIVLRGELINTRIAQLTAAAPQVPWYVHAPMWTGHTNQGQVLGSAAGLGGGGASIALDRYSDRGRTTIRWDRIMRAERVIGVIPDPDRADVMNAFRVEQLRFRKDGELLVSGGVVFDYNRDFVRDGVNFTTTIVYRRGK